jgi:hypothetical protein
MLHEMTREPCGATPATRPIRVSKLNTVIALLFCPERATVSEQVQATGWLPPSTAPRLLGCVQRPRDREALVVLFLFNLSAVRQEQFYLCLGDFSFQTTL